MSQYEIVTQWDQQPQEWVDVDWGSPLAQGLVLCANYSAPSVESVSGRLATSTRATGARELGIALTGTSGLVSYQSSSLINSAAGPSAPRTVFFLLSTTTTGNTVIAEKSSNSNFVCQTLGGKFSWRVVPSSLETVDSTTSINTGRPFAVAGRYSGTTASVFVNGKNEGSRSYTADNSNGDPLVIGARSGNVAPFPGDIYCAFIWARSLSDDEITSLSENPWQLFQRREWVPMAAASGGISLFPSGVPSAETFGSAAITRGNVSILTTGIVSAESFGTHVIGVAGGPQILSPTGIASAMAFGSPQIALGSSGIVVPGVGSGEAFGTPTVGRGLITVIPSGIASAQMFGTPGVLKGTLVIYPGGIPSGESFGIPALVGGTAVETQAVFYVRGFSAFGSRRNS